MAGMLQRLRERYGERKRTRELARAAFRFDKAENPEPYKDQVKRVLLSLPLIGAVGSIIPLFTLGPDFIWLGISPLVVQLTLATHTNKITYLFRVKEGDTALQKDPEGTMELLGQQRREIEN